MKNLLYTYIICITTVLYTSCNGNNNNSETLKQAVSILQSHPDSALKLLSTLNELSDLTVSEQMQLVWNKGQAHFRLGISMMEDTLLPRAIAYYRQKGDSAKLSDTYLLEARYLQWTNQGDSALATIDRGLNHAIALKDTFHIIFFYQYKAESVYQNGDHATAADVTRKMLQYPTLTVYQRYALTYKLGLYLALLGDDTADNYLEQSIDMALTAGDTVPACHYLRNYADYLANNKQYARSNELIQRVRKLAPMYDKYSVLQITLATNYINLHQIDSAQTYWQIAWEHEQRMQAEAKEAANKDFTRLGMLGQMKSILDYATGKNVSITEVGRFSDSIMTAIRNQQSTIVEQLENRQKLQLLNYQLTIDRQQTKLWLIISFVLLITVIIGSYAYIRNRYKRLAEAEDRIDTLKRLLKDAQKAPTDIDSQSTNTDSRSTATDSPQPEDDAFFKKILLQQLGIIRLVATTPTSHNQALLKQISGISNHEIPVDSLLVWSDLYPVIDKLYNGFYTRLMERFGSVLSDKEVQICCLLCAKFSTKEIGVITQQTSATIYVRKSSIRKKLGVEEKQDIVDFMNAI